MQGGQRRSDCISLQHDCQDSSGVLQGSVARRWNRTVPLREEAWTVVTGPLAPNLSLQYSPLQTIPTGRKERLSLSVRPRYKNYNEHVSGYVVLCRQYVRTEHSDTLTRLFGGLEKEEYISFYIYQVSTWLWKKNFTKWAFKSYLSRLHCHKLTREPLYLCRDKVNWC